MRPHLPPDDLELVLSRTPEFWSRFKGARLFITGGTGFIGSWLLEVIQRANLQLGASIEVVVLSRDPARAHAAAPHLFDGPYIRLCKGDVADFIAPAGSFDLCIHAAADVGDKAKARAYREVFDGAFFGTRRVLDFVSSSGVQHFLLASSGAVYGPQPPDLLHLTEDFGGAPDCLAVGAAYGNGKRVAEWLTAEASARGTFNAAIARIFALVGPNIPLDGPLAAGNFVRDAVNRKAIQIEGDGKPLRSYLYIADACVWLLKIMMDGRSCLPYNVGSERAIAMSELAARIASLAHMPAELVVRAGVLEAIGNGLPPRYVPDTARARLGLTLAEYTSLEGALIKTIEWNRTAMHK